MANDEKVLIMQDEDISVYSEDFLSCVPNGRRIGGIITVVNNHNNESLYKEWKWYQYSDGTVFNDKKYVIDMTSNYVRQLIDKEKEGYEAIYSYKRERPIAR